MHVKYFLGDLVALCLKIPTKGLSTQLVRKPKTGTNSTHSYFRPHSLATTPLPFSPPPSFAFYTEYPFLSMLLSSLAFLIYASASALAQSQTPIVYDVAHNATPISGTWSSGSRNVTTGAVRMFACFLWHSFIRGNRVELR